MGQTDMLTALKRIDVIPHQGIALMHRTL